MNTNTDVLIVGAGPTGLMMACQLLRFGIPFRILDKLTDRTHESRAFGIQAKSMEIFQNLGIASQFLKVVHPGTAITFYVNGQKKITVDINNIGGEDSPFHTLFFLPQNETERILIEYLEARGVVIERQTELLAFTQHNESVTAKIKNNISNQTEEIACRYIVGCDGAHSAVRHALNLSFEGAPYEQEFILADCSVDWSFPRDQFLFFTTKDGILAYIPLTPTMGRFLVVERGDASHTKSAQPNLEEVESLARKYTRAAVKLSNPIWLARFRLHHRGVNHYRQGSAFLAGDAAHIHSPVGGQGMNTGLQDATNLAWKMAFVLKGISPEPLLDTYETERLRVGQILLKTTDRFFSFATSNTFLLSHLRIFLMPLIFKFLFSKKDIRKKLFRFVSQLGIHYHKSAFVYEITAGADAIFLAGPQAGCRAPDAPTNTSTLFEILQNNKCHVLIFQSNVEQSPEYKNALNDLQQAYKDLIRIDQFMPTAANDILFKRYGVTSSAIYFIRPDGYIGFRSWGCDNNALIEYLKIFFNINFKN